MHPLARNPENLIREIKSPYLPRKHGGTGNYFQEIISEDLGELFEEAIKEARGHVISRRKIVSLLRHATERV